jgi:hypothetical protein
MFPHMLLYTIQRRSRIRFDQILFLGEVLDGEVLTQDGEVLAIDGEV